MPLTATISQAIERLRSFYEGTKPYDPATNPGGLRRGGSVFNFVPALQDMATAAQGMAVLTDDIVASGSASGRIYQTLAALQADLSPPDKTGAQVIGDGGNNGLYAKSGASGAGTWTLLSRTTLIGLGALAFSLNIARADIPSTVIPVSTFKVAGFATVGDLGAGAQYVRGTGFMQIQDATGAWFHQVWQDGIHVGHTGAKGDGTGDDGPAFNLLDALLTARQGGAFRIPAGAFRVVTPVLIDVTGNADEIVTRGKPVIGAGMSACRVICDTGSNFAMEVRATALVANNSSYNSYQTVKGIKFTSSGINVGNGLLMNCTAICDLEDVAAVNLDNGLKTLDVHTANFRNCILRYNKVGHFGVAQVNLSSPNAFSYVGCNINGNIDWGVVLQNASVMDFFGGTLEFNGLGSSLAQSGAVRLAGSGRNGTVACNFNGTWFEANAGAADVWCDHGPYYATYNFNGCLFNRTNNTVVIGGKTYNYFTVNNILLIVPTGGSARLNVQNCGFKGFNDYPASSSRAYINIAGGGAANVIFSESGNRYDNPIEAPVPASGRLLARGRITGAGSLTRSWNVASVTRLDVGRYKVTFSDPGRASTGRTVIGSVDVIGLVRFDGEDANSVSFSVISNGNFVDPGTAMFAIYE